MPTIDLVRLFLQGLPFPVDLSQQSRYLRLVDCFLFLLCQPQALTCSPGEFLLVRKYRLLLPVIPLSLFGSVLKGTMKPDSDVDLLVEFYPAHIPGLFGLASMEIELSKILGRKADLRTPQDLSRYFRKEVMKSAKVQYAER